MMSKKKRREKVVIGQTLDESKYAERIEEPRADKIYTGLIVSQDKKQNYYIYCPILPYETQLPASPELPKDLKISDFIQFKCDLINT